MCNSWHNSRRIKKLFVSLHWHKVPWWSIRKEGTSPLYKNSVISYWEHKSHSKHSAAVEINLFFFAHQGEIHRVKSDGTNRTEFAPAAILGSPVGLALDWITENLYYTNPATQSIEVRRLILLFFTHYYYIICASKGHSTATMPYNNCTCLCFCSARFWSWEGRYSTGKL